MPVHLTPTNRFKQRLYDGEVQYGIFVGLADAVAAEISASAGFDWVLVDAEHGPNDLRTILHQLHAISARDCPALVRVPSDDPVFIKRVLDLGAQTLLVPMVDSADQAEQLVAAVRYPPEGIRGVGTSLTRAATWGHTSDYLARADDEICLVVQVESRAGLEALPSICAVGGLDAVFVGPSDLAASLGHRGEPGHEAVEAAVVSALGTVRDAGLAAGVYGATPDRARAYVGHGARIVAVGIDTALLAAATAERARAVLDVNEP